MPTRHLRDIIVGQQLIACTPDETVRAVARRMQGNHVGAVLVLDDGEPVGIFTGTNLISHVIEPGLNPETIHVADVMTPDPLCLDDTSYGIDAVRLMRDHHIRHVVVRCSGQSGFGMVSVRDFPDSEMGDYEDEFAFEQKIWEEM